MHRCRPTTPFPQATAASDCRTYTQALYFQRFFFLCTYAALCSGDAHSDRLLEILTATVRLEPLLDRKAAGLSTSGCPGLPTLACTPVRASVHSLQDSPLISAVKRLGKSFGRGLGKEKRPGKKSQTTFGKGRKKAWKGLGRGPQEARKRERTALPTFGAS